MEKPFAEIDHSGDIGIEVRANNIAELITYASHGLFSLLYRGTVNAAVARPIRVETRSLEDLIVDWLNEVIAMVGAHGEFYASVEIHSASETLAEGVLRGEPVDIQRHDPRFDVKAATYHGLSITRDNDDLLARVIFDL